jgi:hypothetical protein
MMRFFGEGEEGGCLVVLGFVHRVFLCEKGVCEWNGEEEVQRVLLLFRFTYKIPPHSLLGIIILKFVVIGHLVESLYTNTTV